MSPAFPILFACALLASQPVMAAPAWESRPLREIALQTQRLAQAQVVSLNTTRMTAEIAARRRVVPILITTSTTIGGLLALALGLGGKRCCGGRWRSPSSGVWRCPPC
ncbi:MAG: hypothetical protein ACUVT2_11030 [Thiobacillaceae bacterium]